MSSNETHTPSFFLNLIRKLRDWEVSIKTHPLPHLQDGKATSQQGSQAPGHSLPRSHLEGRLSGRDTWKHLSLCPKLPADEVSSRECGWKLGKPYFPQPPPCFPPHPPRGRGFMMGLLTMPGPPSPLSQFLRQWLPTWRSELGDLGLLPLPDLKLGCHSGEAATVPAPSSGALAQRFCLVGKMAVDEFPVRKLPLFATV